MYVCTCIYIYILEPRQLRVHPVAFATGVGGHGMVDSHNKALKRNNIVSRLSRRPVHVHGGCGGWWSGCWSPLPLAHTQHTHTHTHTRHTRVNPTHP